MSATTMLNPKFLEEMVNSGAWPCNKPFIRDEPLCIHLPQFVNPYEVSQTRKRREFIASIVLEFQADYFYDVSGEHLRWKFVTVVVTRLDPVGTTRNKIKGAK